VAALSGAGVGIMTAVGCVTAVRVDAVCSLDLFIASPSARSVVGILAFKLVRPPVGGARDPMIAMLICD
jgi:hypothetical protein